jgi:hypothetical protein
MAHQTNTSLSRKYSRFSQQGAALILIAFIIGLGAAAYLLETFDTKSLQTKQDIKTYQALKDAKVALIAWAVNHPNTPGLMPYPDRNGDGNYDDTSDCYASNISFNPIFTLGRLPLFKSDPNCINTKSTVTSGLAENLKDGGGERLWYEVSRNLLHDYKSTGPNPDGTSPIINPSIVDSPTYPWFVVRDRNGAVISNRVAAVIISPGPPSANQARSSSISDANQYLDKIVMADGTPYQNYGYQDSAVTPVQEFIVGDDFKAVSKTDPTYKNQTIEPYYYNDKLIYITIDELMYALEKRVLSETKDVLKNYYTNSSAGVNTKFFPYAAALGSSSNPNQCVQGNLQGLLPTNAASNYDCSCTSARSCTCSFGAISAVSYTRTSSSYGRIGVAAPTGACTVGGASNRTCTCTGLGTCKSTSGAVRFTCDACGVCAVLNNQPGTFTFTSTAGFSSATGACSNSGGNISCDEKTVGAAGTFTLNTCADPALATSASGLPTWFTSNGWQNYIYYAVSSNCTSSASNCTSATPQLTVGSKAGVRSLLIASGKSIIATPFASSKATAQSARPSCDVKDYLDSVQNTNVNLVNGAGDLVYDAINSPRGASYNDQTFIVAP